MAEDETEAPEMGIICEDEAVCPLCQAEFIEIEDLQTHIVQFHRKPSQTYDNHPCRFCDESFACALDFAEHIRDSHIINIKSCSFCIRAFVSRQELWDHEAKHYLNYSPMFSCSACPMMFTDLGDLEYHELNCHNEGPGMMLQQYYPELSFVLCSQADRFMQNIGCKTLFNCTCKYSTNDIMVYIKHLQANNCKCLVCNTCHKVFGTKAQLVQHIRHVQCARPHNTNIIKCQNCYKAITKNDTKKHKAKCKAFVCQKCEIKFDNIAELTCHQQEKHSKPSIIVKGCRYCFKSLVGLEMFKSHVVNQHQSEYSKYKYACVYCNKIFNHPQRLFAHFSSTHSSLRPFVCNICQKTFRLRSKFTYHIKLDHESKGFVEFTKELNVHFNAEKSLNTIQLSPPSSLFTAEEEEEFKKHNIELEPLVVINVKDEHNKQKRSSNDIKHRTVISNETVIDDSEEPEAPSNEKNETKAAGDDFESSDNEPIVPKKSQRMKNKIAAKLMCHICHLKCYTIDNYNRHMRSHIDKKHRSKECFKCNKTFRNIAYLKRHIQKEHTTKLVSTLKNIIEKRKQASQPIARLIKKKPFKCNIQKVYINPDYRPTAEITVFRKDSEPTNSNQNTGESKDTALLRILGERAVPKVRPKILMKKCDLDERLDNLPVKGITMNKWQPINSHVENYEPAKLTRYYGPAKSKFNFNNMKHEENQTGEYFEEDFANNDSITISDIQTEIQTETYEQSIETKQTEPIQHEMFMIPSIQNREIIETTTLINEQTKKFGNIKVATFYYTESGTPAYKIVPFSIKKIEPNEESEDIETAAEPKEETATEALPGIPKLVQSNPLAHLMDSNQLLSLRAKKRSTVKLENPQLKIAQALMELKAPNKKPASRHRPKKPRIVKAARKQNTDVFKYEILDENAENWVFVDEEVA